MPVTQDWIKHVFTQSENVTSVENAVSWVGSNQIITSKQSTKNPKNRLP